jgi:hypothetical protein
MGRARFLPAILLLLGCDSSSEPPKPVVTQEDAGTCPPKCPVDPQAPKCSTVAKVETCPNNECMYHVPQSGDVIMLRFGREKLIKPDALLSLAPIAVDPNLNPPCFNGGKDSFNWLLKIDKKASTLTVGGARPSPDGKTYTYLDESVDGSKLSSVCPGFVGATTPYDLRPKTSRITIVNGKFTSEKSDKINVPIFDGEIPIVLPLSEANLVDVQLSPDGNCVGKWQRDYWCDGDSLGWTTDGMVQSKILVADADKVPVKSAGCQSLCAILANDATKTEGKTCKKNADGTYPEIGDTCVGGTSCKNAWALTAAFAAYGVTIK